MTLNPGLGSLKVIEIDTIGSGADDFLLTFHSNYRPTSHRFRDKRRFPSKIAKKIPLSRVLYAPADEVPIGIGYRCEESKQLD